MILVAILITKSCNRVYNNSNSATLIVSKGPRYFFGGLYWLLLILIGFIFMLSGFLLLLKEFIVFFVGFLLFLIAFLRILRPPTHFNGLPMIPLNLRLQEILIGVQLI